MPYHASGPDSGFVSLDRTVITYTGLEPIVDTSIANERVFRDALGELVTVDGTTVSVAGFAPITYAGIETLRVENEQEQREWTTSFVVQGDHSVPFELFNVIATGTIQVEVSWVGDSDELQVELTGRRRPGLPDPAAPYAEGVGTSPLVLSYDVTGEDLARAWAGDWPSTTSPAMGPPAMGPPATGTPRGLSGSLSPSTRNWIRNSNGRRSA